VSLHLIGFQLDSNLSKVVRVLAELSNGEGAQRLSTGRDSIQISDRRIAKRFFDRFCCVVKFAVQRA
jgi:hypothetical protein